MTDLALVFVIAALTALGTAVGKDWLPTLVRGAYDQLRQEPLMIVSIQSNGQPLGGVTVDLVAAASDQIIASGTTSPRGIARLHGIHKGRMVVEVVLLEGRYERRYVKIHNVESLPYELELDRDRDFSAQAPLVVAAPTPPSPTPPEHPKVQYGKPLLSADRQVQARLHIDWIKGMPRPKLQVETSTSITRLEDVLREVGIDLEVVWGNELPITTMGPDGRFSEKELIATMEAYRDDVPSDMWHFYLIYGGRHQTPGLTSIMFDTDHRGGAAVFPEEPSPVSTHGMFLILHEMGHMLNLPHPWQAYGDTRSVMSMPWRWSDWSWTDPAVYRFDAFGEQHIRRAPDDYVRPDGSAFLDYGGPTPWSE